jgi:hypothetical protein
VPDDLTKLVSSLRPSCAQFPSTSTVSLVLLVVDIVGSSSLFELTLCAGRVVPYAWPQRSAVRPWTPEPAPQAPCVAFCSPESEFASRPCSSLQASGHRMSGPRRPWPRLPSPCRGRADRRRQLVSTPTNLSNCSLPGRIPSYSTRASSFPRRTQASAFIPAPSFTIDPALCHRRRLALTASAAASSPSPASIATSWSLRLCLTTVMSPSDSCCVIYLCDYDLNSHVCIFAY